MTSGSAFHRRPSYAERERLNPGAGLRRTGSTRNRARTMTDYGVENYGFDGIHVEKWAVPVNLLIKLPRELQEYAEEWQYAGAALCSGLDRIDKLENESLHRGWPAAETSSHPHLLPRRVSNAQAISSGVDTPPMSSPEDSAPASYSNQDLSRLTLVPSSYGGPSTRSSDVESPPVTPIDSNACPTPDNAHGVAIPGRNVPTVDALSRQMTLNSIRGRGNSTVSQRSSVAAFDEKAWDTYFGTMKAEIQLVQSDTFQRVKGLCGKIDRLCVEYCREKPEYKDAIVAYATWWVENKRQVAEYEDRVRGLELPNLDLVRAERRANGWSV